MSKIEQKSPSQFVANMKEAASHLIKAQEIMQRGPLTYYLSKLASHSEVLLTRFAPIKIGERALIIKHIECKNGWKGCEETLKIGATGTIQEVDFEDGKFFFKFAPDREWYQDRDGKYVETEVRHNYSLSESFLVRLSE